MYHEISDDVFLRVAGYINERSNKKYNIPIIGSSDNSETPQIFEIVPFNEIDSAPAKFYAIDGSYNSQEFYNGLTIALFCGGYVCYCEGKKICLSKENFPISSGKVYYPEHILLTNQEDIGDIYDELLEMTPVKNLLEFFEGGDAFAYSKDAVCHSVSSILGFCQEILEWSLVYEILNHEDTKPGDFILKDGTLRSLNIKQTYLIKLGKFAHNRKVNLLAITKNSPIKLELSYTLKQIDDYLQDHLKPKYEFKEKNPKNQKLGCWFEVPMPVLCGAYKGNTSNMYIKKGLSGGRGCGVFHVARLDYVEKLQNYDWLITDINIFDAYPDIETDDLNFDTHKVAYIHRELTRLTQEHYILGYPYPLVEAHNFVTLKQDFRKEIINRVKLSLYKDKRMDHIDIENLFVDTHNRF